MQQITSNDVSNNSLVALLFHQHAQAILIYLHRYISSKEDADDILVEVFLAALENRTLLTLSDDQQRSWLKKVAHNKAIDYRRSAAFRLKAPLIRLPICFQTMSAMLLNRLSCGMKMRLNFAKG
ncbi:RNA polymerase sigma factor [Ktedonosporobacter rubrisoli]|nr:sigma factor [Ktedonosporobacter rubrisoli]